MRRPLHIPAVVLIAISIISCAANAQSYSDLIARADDFYQRHMFAESAAAYDKALQTKGYLNPTDYYNAACSHSLSGNIDQALSYFKLAFVTYKGSGTVVSVDNLAADTDLDAIRGHDKFKAVVKQYYSPAEVNYILEKDISEKDLWDLVNGKIKAGINRIRIANKVVYWQKKDDQYIPNDRRVFRSDPLSGTENTTLEFSNCTFEYSLIMGKRFGNLQLDHLTFENCNFKYDAALIQLNLRKPFFFRKCQFNGLLLSANIIGTSRDLEYNDPAAVFDSCQFRSMRFILDLFSEAPLNLTLKNSSVSDSTRLSIAGNNFGEMDFTDIHAPKAFVQVKGTQVNTLNIERSVFNTLSLNDTEITSKFNFKQSELKNQLLLKNSVFNDNPANEIRWTSFANGKLGMIKDFQFVVTDTVDGDGYQKPIVVNGSTQGDFENGDAFASLLGVFSLFLNQYKANNDLESYNKCFVEIKELQSRRLAWLYEKNGGFEAFFRWKLSQLLKFYVRYGTDPARAILISIYIIIAFGIFFFFFPSDWDTSSKTILIRRYRDFVEKNEKGYVKPFFQLVKGFFISLMNAITLSLNAFITLGFGNIPTRGVARYFCVLEGFLGWFLLSIFTVALINQTL